MKHWLIAALVFTSAPAYAATGNATTPQADVKEIGKIVETFRMAIIKKDKPAFMGLLYAPSIPWIGVITDNSLKMIKARATDKSKPAPEKASGTGSATEFIDGIVSDTEAMEETFENVRIDSNGDVAQVYFDYAFLADGYKSNWGQESWQLVRTGAGWKINSVIWSMEFNPERPPPRAKPAGGA